MLRKTSKKIFNGKIRPDLGLNFPYLASLPFMTRKDRLKAKSKRIKPKILDLLDKKKEVSTSDLLKNLEANALEIQFALKELEEEGKIVTE